jgi:hypothetical protein
MGLPLDSVHVGDWLLMVRGPTVKRFTQVGEAVEIVNHEPEGTIMRVLAISWPFVLVKVYPVPCEDPAHPVHPTFNVTWDWRTVEFNRPSRGYLRTYLKLSRRRAVPMHDAFRTAARRLELPAHLEDCSDEDDGPEPQRTK